MSMLTEQAYRAISNTYIYSTLNNQQRLAWIQLCSAVVTVYTLSGAQATYEYLTAYMERNNEQA